MKLKRPAFSIKAILVYVSVALTLNLTMNVEARPYPNAFSLIPSNQSGWAELSRGQKTGDFQLSRNRTLLYKGRRLTGIIFKSTVQQIAVSPPAVNGKYAICVTFDDIDSTGYLLNLDSYSAVRLALQGPPSVWATWSPAGTHAIIASYYEADMTLYSISLPSGRVRNFRFNLAGEPEEESYDLDSLSWIDNRVFRFRATINCNPYTDESCSDEGRKKVLREYEVTANVATLAVTSKRIR